MALKDWGADWLMGSVWNSQAACKQKSLQAAGPTNLECVSAPLHSTGAAQPNKIQLQG
jgi:hypothetical protein